MEWDRLFEDLEDQIASGWEAERAALDAEAERLRIARLDLRTRLGALAADGAAVSAVLTDSTRLSGRLRAVGADWSALQPHDARGLVLLPSHAVELWAVDHGAMLSSGAGSEPLSPLRERMTFGFVVRDIARRRSGVTVQTCSGALLTGTIDRAGADHLDLALHDAGAPRRARAVTGFRLVPFASVLSITTDGPAPAIAD
ncbi:hypothetical protein [Microbacterium capsulatum]|uniref:Uncharacterized protein n=1 Tax=Microbacterium capsulatum TaxID=3041921 RepID=A0ABU0XK07_9MICO|nr:hypothetical protein [Microbacterium sp. ASV81]MDQ4215436.1 hypothetical protein [Microbacterium sp. ASV81]